MKVGSFNIGKGLVWGVLIGGLALFVITTLISFKNQNARIENTFKKQNSDKTAAYDKMWKTLSGKGQIALRNDSSFARNVQAIMDGRKDAPQLFMKWVTETNPNANYSEVSDLYKDLSRSVESERTSFLERETTLSSIVQQQDDLLNQFPGSLYASLMGIKHLEYKPITSDRTDDVIRTGKDNNVKVF